MKRNHEMLTLFVLIGFSTAALAANCPVPPDMPERIHTDGSERTLASPYSARDAAGSFGDMALGVGYLHVEGADDPSGALYYDWPVHVIAPFWSAPEETSFAGWLRNGQVYPHGSNPLPLSGAGLVETDYEQSSFIVWEQSGDWLRVRVLPAWPDIWLNSCHLRIGAAKLRYDPWETFIRQHGDWLHFRADVPHNLRASPDATSNRVTVVGLDHKLVLMELEGDWMRVKVQQPDLTCSAMSDDSARAAEHEGWIKWRDESKGPWVWTYTRGC